MQTVEKWATRSDAWTPNDDEHLASLVLYHIRTGSTQLRAFEDAANQLGRTAAACGYRWNGVVRKNYRTEIDDAKLARKKSQRSGMSSDLVNLNESAHMEMAQLHGTQTDAIRASESIMDVIHFLQTYDAQYQKLLLHLEVLERDKQSLLNRVHELEVRGGFAFEIPAEPLTAQQLEQDSKTLFAIMERARKLLGDTARSRSESQID